MRTIGLDVGRFVAEVAIHEPGRGTRPGGRLHVPDELVAFAATLGPTDQVVLEATANTWPIVELLARHAGRVVVSNPLRTRAIADAKTKTDTIDAATLADLLAADYLPEVWQPDPATRELRRRLSHRAALARERTTHRNRISGILIRNLLRCPWSDPLGRRGRAWLEQLSLPADERSALDVSLRLLDALEAEIGRAETELARLVVDDPRVRHLLTTPGLGVLSAAMLVAVIGDVGRFARPSKLVSYLGLDPRVRQSGARPAWTGHISKAGPSHARALLIEAAHAAVLSPGPLRACYVRLKHRRGPGIAIVAVARKLAILAWHLLADEADYRWAAPSLIARKQRRLELQAGAPSRRGQVRGNSRAAQAAQRVLERAALEGVEAAYVRFVATRLDESDAPAATRGATDHGQRPAARRRSSPQPPHFATGSGASDLSIRLPQADI